MNLKCFFQNFVSKVYRVYQGIPGNSWTLDASVGCWIVYSEIKMSEQLSRESCSHGYNNFEQLSKYREVCCNLA